MKEIFRCMLGENELEDAVRLGKCAQWSYWHDTSTKLEDQYSTFIKYGGVLYCHRGLWCPYCDRENYEFDIRLAKHPRKRITPKRWLIQVKADRLERRVARRSVMLSTKENRNEDTREV